MVDAKGQSAKLCAMDLGQEVGRVSSLSPFDSEMVRPVLSGPWRRFVLYSWVVWNVNLFRLQTHVCFRTNWNLCSCRQSHWPTHSQHLHTGCAEQQQTMTRDHWFFTQLYVFQSVVKVVHPALYWLVCKNIFSEQISIRCEHTAHFWSLTVPKQIKLHEPRTLLKAHLKLVWITTGVWWSPWTRHIPLPVTLIMEIFALSRFHITEPRSK